MFTLEELNAETEEQFLVNLAKCKNISDKLRDALSSASTEYEVKDIIESLLDNEYSAELDWLYSTLLGQEPKEILEF